MSLFIDTALNKGGDRPPVWIMRQAGRYIPEYNEIKAKQADGSFWKMLQTPELAANVTLLPEKYLAIDALILFSDILVFFPAIGLDLVFNPGPKLNNNITELGLNRLKHPSLQDELSHVFKTIRLVKQSSKLPLIGFAGAPYTLLCYSLASHQKDKNYETPRKLYWSDKKYFLRLLDYFSELITDYLKLQITSGVDAVMLFDTWAGTLNYDIFDTEIVPRLNNILTALDTKLPKIYYTTPTSHLLPAINKLEADVVAIDWRTPFNAAAQKLPNKVIQGNLDPTMLFAAEETIKTTTEEFISKIAPHRNGIINLGAGILPQTPLKSVQKFCEFINLSNYKNYV